MIRRCGAGVFACPFFLAALLTAQPPTVAAPDVHLEATNLTTIKSALVGYVKSGQYDREIAEVVKQARAAIETRTTSATPNEKPAAVFDIDETTISNLPNMLACEFCLHALELKMGNPSPAIAPVLELYNFAKSKGVSLLVVTGRPESRRAETIKQIEAAGYSGWQELVLRPDGETGPVGPWKATARAALESKGYKIVLNIGDQASDLQGGHAERTYKLPNPFYLVQ